jgi:hypothetical protein
MLRIKYTHLITILILVLFLLFIIFRVNISKELKTNNYEENEFKFRQLKYFDTKYSLNDMYDLLYNSEIPNDDEFYDIILNWFDYFEEDNLFINRFGDSYNIDEYTKIKNEYSDETLKVLLISAKKSWFLPVLNK